MRKWESGLLPDGFLLRREAQPMRPSFLQRLFRGEKRRFARDRSGPFLGRPRDARPFCALAHHLPECIYLASRQLPAHTGFEAFQSQWAYRPANEPPQFDSDGGRHVSNLSLLPLAQYNPQPYPFFGAAGSSIHQPEPRRSSDSLCQVPAGWAACPRFRRGPARSRPLSISTPSRSLTSASVGGRCATST